MFFNLCSEPDKVIPRFRLQVALGLRYMLSGPSVIDSIAIAIESLPTFASLTNTLEVSQPARTRGRTTTRDTNAKYFARINAPIQLEMVI